MELQHRLTDQLDALLENLRIYQEALPDEIRDDAMPVQLQIRRHRNPPVKFIRSRQPGPEGCHARIPFQVLEESISTCLDEIRETIITAAPYFDTDWHELTFQISRDLKGVRVLINEIGLQVLTVPTALAAATLSSICRYLASLPARAGLYDVCGLRVQAATPQEALSIYAILLHPENPVEFIGKRQHTVVERHQGVQPDSSLFRPV